MHMITVIVTVEENGTQQLAKTLENLISYALEGFVQEVVVLHDALDDMTRHLAEEAGCNLVENKNFQAVCSDARGDWLLFMEAGAVLAAGWADIVSAHANADGGAASFQLTVSNARPFWQRLFKPRVFKSPLARGLLISKRQARANFKSQETAAELMRGLAVKRLRAKIIRA